MTGGLIILSIVRVLVLCFPHVRQFEMAQAREAAAPRWRCWSWARTNRARNTHKKSTAAIHLKERRPG